jgi:hypothetical protein
VNRLALGMHGVAVLLFVAYHFLPGFGVDFGWVVWPQIAESISDPGIFKQPTVLAIVASFLMVTSLIVASPFLSIVFRRSRISWWLATVMSGLAMVVLGGLILTFNELDKLGPGEICLLASSVFHFIGMLMIRKERPPVPVIPSD